MIKKGKQFKLISCPNCGGDEEPWGLRSNGHGKQTCCKCGHTFKYKAKDIDVRTYPHKEELEENRIAIYHAPDEGLRKFEELVKLGGPKNRHEIELLDHVQKERARRKLEKYLTGKPIRKMKKKNLKEEAPTNSMGNSSSTHGSGAIDGYDPLVKRKLKSFRTVARKDELNRFRKGSKPVSLAGAGNGGKSKA